MLQEQRFWLLVSLKLSQEATAEELEELEALLQKRPEYLQRVEQLEKMWNIPANRPVKKAEDAFDHHLQRLSSQAGQGALHTEESVLVEEEPVSREIKVRKYRLFWLGAIAAASVVLFLVLRPGNDASPEPLINTVNTNAYSKANVSLPDGSKVQLNRGSKITYNDDFRGDVREVFLSGEAFFDVAKDQTRPFIIHTKTIDLKVLGTSFNVRSYDEDKETETALVHGSVEIALRSNPDQKIILKPGEKLVVKDYAKDFSSNEAQQSKDFEEQQIAVLSKMRYYGRDSSSIETSWTRKQLMFEQETLREIASKIERWYNVKVIIEDNDLLDKKYTALFEEETLQEVLEALKLTGGFRYVLKNRQVTIGR